MKKSNTDVAVVGSGFAGLSAAIAAARAGASVILVEKEKSCGGNSRVSGGTLTVVGSPIQKREGIADSFALLKQDMLTAGRQLNNAALVEVLIRESYPTLQWLTDELGVKFKDRVDRYGGHSVPRNHSPETISGSTILTAMLTQATALGVDIRTQTRLTQLLTKNSQAPTSPIVTGVIIKVREREMQQIEVKRGVVLATGGFSGDRAFLQQQAPHLPPDLDHTNVPNATAEALIEAMRIGGKGVDLEQVQLVPWVSPDETGYGIAPIFASYTMLAYGLAVDPATGKRFINELADRKTWVDTLLTIGHPCIGIADRVGMENSGIDIEPYLVDHRAVVKKFATLSSLAAEYDIPDIELQATLNRYNELVGSLREDREFGKSLCDRAQPLSEPFYGVRLWPKVHYTMGGVKIDTRARVLGVGDIPITGLYAAGEVTGGIHGACRLGGCAITECMVFGRIAGKNVAEQ